MTDEVQRIVNGITDRLQGDDLQVLDYELDNEARTRCRLILRAEYQYGRPVSDEWIEASEAPWGAYGRRP